MNFELGEACDVLERGPRVVTTMQCSFLRESRVLSPQSLREWIDRWIDFRVEYVPTDEYIDSLSGDADVIV